MSKMNTFFVLSLFIPLLLSCSSKVAGGTEAESTIALRVVAPSDVDLSAVRVRFLSSSYMSNGKDEKLWLNTDKNGKIEFVDVEPGFYTIELRYASAELALGAVEEIQIKEKEKKFLDSLSLFNLSSIEGQIAKGEGPSVIRIAGLERFVVPDSSGYFTIDSLPEGVFNLWIESQSNKGSLSLNVETGVENLEIEFEVTKAFILEDFEGFLGYAKTAAYLGDAYWFSLDYKRENLTPLWTPTSMQPFVGGKDCVAGSCVHLKDYFGFYFGSIDSTYILESVDTLYFTAKGSGSMVVGLAYGEYGDLENALVDTVILQKNWTSYAIAIAEMKGLGKAKNKNLTLNRIYFSTTSKNVFLDDISMAPLAAKDLEKLQMNLLESKKSEFPGEDWSKHDALLKEVEGYGLQTQGGAGGSICIVKTEEDILQNEDESYTVAPGSLRECAMKEEPVWIQFEKDGLYRLSAPLRIKSFKTIDGRGRQVKIAGMGILADSASHLIFENLHFTSPAITEKDSTSRRALSIHNQSKNVWVDHCLFEDYPLVLMDVKRKSDSVTVSWSRFQNSGHAILLGLNPEIYHDTMEFFTAHHNYFVDLESSAILNHGNPAHYYNNFFVSTEDYALQCLNLATCYLEGNIFNIENTIKKENAKVFSLGDWLLWSDGVFEDAISKPSYKYILDKAKLSLARRIQMEAGPR